MGPYYSGDPKTDPSKTGHFEGRISNGRPFKNRKFLSGFRMVLTIWQPFQQNHLKTRPFENRTKVDHLKSGHIRILDPHCIGKRPNNKLFLVNLLTRFAFPGINILVATPGRLLDHLQVCVLLHLIYVVDSNTRHIQKHPKFELFSVKYIWDLNNEHLKNGNI